MLKVDFSHLLIRRNIVATILLIEVVFLSIKLVDAWYTKSVEKLIPIFGPVFDPPWQADGTLYISKPIWGVHYFGDLQDLMTSASWANPWGKSPTQHLPLGIGLISLLGVFGINSTFILFVAGMIVLFVFVIQTWMASETFESKVVFEIDMLLLNHSSFWVVDRGSLLFYALAILLLAFYRFLILNRANLTTALLIAIAVSLKTFMVFPLCFFLFVGKNRVKFLGLVLICLTTLNFGAMYSYEGSIFANFERFISTTLNYGNEYVVSDTSQAGASFYRLVIEASKRYGLFEGGSPYLGPVSATLWLILVGVVLANSRTPIWMKLIAAFSTVQMVLPAGPYTMAWNFIPLLVMPKNKYANTKYVEFERFEQTKHSAILRVLITLAVLVACLPFDMRFWLSPLLWTLVLVWMALSRSTLQNFRRFKVKLS